jgi:hypothetical protein
MERVCREAMFSMPFPGYQLFPALLSLLLLPTLVRYQYRTIIITDGGCSRRTGKYFIPRAASGSKPSLKMRWSSTFNLVTDTATVVTVGRCVTLDLLLYRVQVHSTTAQMSWGSSVKAAYLSRLIQSKTPAGTKDSASLVNSIC